MRLINDVTFTGESNWFERQLTTNKRAEASLSGIGFAGCASRASKAVAVGILLGTIDESGFDRILNDIVAVLNKALPITYAHFGNPRCQTSP